MIEIIVLLILRPRNLKKKIIIQNIIFLLIIDYLFSINNIWIEISNIYFFNFQDKYCFILIILTLWIRGIILIITEEKKRSIIVSLITIICFTLSSMRLIIFYFWFEIRLIPLFLIIFWWGKSKERNSASIYILIYTIFGSLPLLLSIFTFYNIIKSTEWDYLIIFNIENESIIVYWNTIIAFLIKIPVFGFHIWLPKAHVEAPVYGSIILARIVLKLGGIGLIRIIILNVKRAIKFNVYIIIIFIIGSLIIRILCILQFDIKIIVAYSSIVHIGIATISIITIYKWGFRGSIIIIIGHGLCSSRIFFLVNIIYIRRGTRIIFLNKGISRINPKITFLWFITCVGNLGAPISLNFISEIIITNSIVVWSTIILPRLILINLFRRIFSIQLFIFTIHGNLRITNLIPTKIIEYIIIILHILPLNFISINSWIWNINFYLVSLIKTLKCGFKDNLKISKLLNHNNQEFFFF